MPAMFRSDRVRHGNEQQIATDKVVRPLQPVPYYAEPGSVNSANSHAWWVSLVRGGRSVSTRQRPGKQRAGVGPCARSGSSASAKRPFFDGGWSCQVKGTGHTHSLNYFAAPRTAGSAATIETRRAGTQGGSAAPRGAGERDPTSGRGPPKPSERSSAQCQLACALH